MTLLQPAIDQQMHPTPSFLSILTTFEHGDFFPCESCPSQPAYTLMIHGKPDTTYRAA
ncbi:protein of unknown function [Pseudomonas mediterranea]